MKKQALQVDRPRGISYGFARSTQYPNLTQEIRQKGQTRPDGGNYFWPRELPQGFTEFVYTPKGEHFILIFNHDKSDKSWDFLFILRSQTMVQAPIVVSPDLPYHGMGCLTPEHFHGNIFPNTDMPKTWTYAPGPQWDAETMPWYDLLEGRNLILPIPNLPMKFKHPLFEGQKEVA